MIFLPLTIILGFFHRYEFLNFLWYCSFRTLNQVLNPNKQVQMTSRECKACVCAHVCQPQTVPRYAFSLHFIYSIIKSHEDYSSPSPLPSTSLLLSFSMSSECSVILRDIIQVNIGEWWRSSDWICVALTDYIIREGL